MNFTLPTFFQKTMTPPNDFETYDKQNFRPAKAKGQRMALPPGAYTLHADDNGVFFRAHNLTTDELIHSDDPREVQLREEVRTFFSSGHLYAKHGFTHRRGVLLHGPAGSGKSCLLRSFCQQQIQDGKHVLIIDHSDDPTFVHNMLTLLQNKDPKATVIVVIEELEEYVKRRGEHSLLAMLDGERSLEGALVVATTNYPEQLNARILNRPRRFDRVVYIGMPGEAVRAEYFKRKLHIDEIELGEWLEASVDFSFAAMADLVISVKCLGMPLQKAACSIRAMQDATPNSQVRDESVPCEPPQYAVMAPKNVLSELYADLTEGLERAEKRQAQLHAHPFTQPIIERIEESAQLTGSAGCE